MLRSGSGGVACRKARRGGAAVCDGAGWLVGHTLQAWRVRKLHAAAAPFLILADHIFGDKNHMGVPSDEFVFLRFGLRSDKGKHRTAIWRANCHPPLGRTNPNITHQSEAELIDVKAQALVLIADEDVNGVNAEMLTLPPDMNGRLILDEA
jgi:hypothetical protein